jgi:hypothetical protein
MMKTVLFVAALVASASAFSPSSRCVKLWNICEIETKKALKAGEQNPMQRKLHAAIFYKTLCLILVSA